MSKSKRSTKMAMGLFLVLSVVVFGSILYTCFACFDNEIVSVDADADYAHVGARVLEYSATEDDLALKEMPAEFDPGYWKGITRGDTVLLPE